MYTRTLAKKLQPGDVFWNRGEWCVVDYVNVGTGVNISARQAFTQVKSNLYASYDATVRTPLVDNFVSTDETERCTCDTLRDRCDACLLSGTNF